MKLRSKDRCPIHRRFDCCGRTKRLSGGAVRVLDDGREICSPAELRRRRIILLERQNNICGWCEKPITDFRDAVTDHINLRGLGGAFRNDSLETTRATHSACNLERGSKRYLTRKEMLRAEKKSKQVPA